MNIFAMDTTGAELSLAVRKKDRTFAFARELAAPNDETLLPQAKRLLARSGLAWKDLDAVAVASGPGRFTGIRIGMAFAAVLAGRLRVPALAVSRFAALAAKTPGALVCAVLPGWRDEMFYQLFRGGRAAAAPVWATAEQWARAKSELPRQGAVLADSAVRAEDLLPCAERLLRAKRRPRFEPLYLKPASYELKAKAGAAR